MILLKKGQKSFNFYQLSIEFLNALKTQSKYELLTKITKPREQLENESKSKFKLHKNLE